MAYVGQGIKGGTFSVLDTSGNTYNGSNTTFSLGTQVGSAAQLLVSHDGVIQKAGTDYTLATGGTQITFTTAPASGASIFITEISGAVGAPMNRDINGDELILDADADTSITADTDDQIDIRIAGNDDFKLTAKTLTIGGGAAADTMLVFDGNAVDYRLGIDDSADTFEIGIGSTHATTPQMTFSSSGIVVNEGSSDYDFRVESNGEANIFAVNGGDDIVLLRKASNTSSASGTNGVLKIMTNDNAGGQMQMGSNDAGYSWIQASDGSAGYPLCFQVSGGKVGIGNTSPGTAKLNVQQNSDQLYYGKNDSSGQFQVTSAGVISATNTTVASISDERLKKDIADFSGGLDIIKAMRPRTYKWKNPQYHNDKDDTQYGFVAQELLTISNAEKLNLVVVDDATSMMYENEKDLLPDGKANISGYQERDAIYVSAIKELLTKIETLETKVAALEG